MYYTSERQTNRSDRGGHDYSAEPCVSNAFLLRSCVHLQQRLRAALLWSLPVGTLTGVSSCVFYRSNFLRKRDGTEISLVRARMMLPTSTLKLLLRILLPVQVPSVSMLKSRKRYLPEPVLNSLDERISKISCSALAAVENSGS